MKTKEKIIASEQKQLARLQKTSAKGNYAGYFFVLLVLIALVNIIDEVTSNLSVSVQSSFVTEFFVNRPFLGKVYNFEEGLALHTTVSVISYVFGIITPFYKALADKWGRKPLFAISTFGMALGLFIIYFSPNYLVFLLSEIITKQVFKETSTQKIVCWEIKIRFVPNIQSNRCSLYVGCSFTRFNTSNCSCLVISEIFIS